MHNMHDWTGYFEIIIVQMYFITVNTCSIKTFWGNKWKCVTKTVSSTYFSVLQLDINTVAAGGGSMLFFRAGMFVVGPESAGADPGPACYMKGTCTLACYTTLTISNSLHIQYTCYRKFWISALCIVQFLLVSSI